MGEDRPDRELLQSWGDGDLAAGRALFERYFASLHRFFRAKTDGGVDDLIQQTLLGCLEARARYRGDSSFRTYLFQIARFQLYSYFRARHRERAIDFTVESAFDLADSPSAVVARQEDARILLQALRSIPLDAQVVLELWFWEELSGAEIAEVLQIPAATVRSRLRRALERLRVELDALSGGDAAALQTDDDLQRWAQRLRDAVDDER